MHDIVGVMTAGCSGESFRGREAVREGSSRQTCRRVTRVRVLSICVSATLVCAWTALGGASASASPEVLWTACAGGQGAGQCSIPRGIGVNHENGHLFIADSANTNNRVVELNARGDFIKMWGWDVVLSGPGDTAEDEFEICIPAIGDECQRGVRGAGIGQFAGPQGMEVDSEGYVYVVDRANRRMQKFDEEGHFILMFGGEVNETSGGNVCPRPGFPADVCKAAVAASGGGEPGEFASGSGWAVGSVIAIYDKGTESAADDIIYIGDEERIQVFDTDGVYQRAITLPEETVSGLAIDSGGDLYTIYSEKPDVRKIEPVAGEELESPRFKLPLIGALEDEQSPTAVTVGYEDHIFAFGETIKEGSELDPIHEFDANGKEITAFGQGEYNSSTGLAANLCEGSEPPGNLYVANANSSAFVRAYGTEAVGCFKALTLPADPIEETQATLNGTVNPKGETVEDCSFEYGLSTAYGQSAECEPNAGEIGTGSKPVPVQAEISGLDPGTIYHFRLVAKVGGETEKGADLTFKTLGPAVISEEHVRSAATTEASLRAFINPEGLAATCNFEYGPTPEYGQSTPLQAVGQDRTEHVLAASISSLIPGATYHWRAVCDNASGPTQGGDHLLRTYRSFEPIAGCPNDGLRGGRSALLPDCRAYEMVSPVEKNGGNVLLASEGNVQASLDGEKITYSTLPSFGDQPNAYTINQYLATRAAGSWSNHGIHPPASGEIVVTSVPTRGIARDFLAFTPDLCSAWMWDYMEPSFTLEGQTGFGDLYRRDNCSPGEDGLEALTPEPPAIPEDTDSVYVNYLSVQGISDDGRHAIFVARTPLPHAPEAAGGENGQIYDRFCANAEGEICTADDPDGKVSLVSVLPAGTPSAAANAVGSDVFNNLIGAVSVDAGRVYWTAGVVGTNGEGRIFLREHPEQGIVEDECNPAQPEVACTVKVNANLTTSETPDDALFWTAARDGSRALYSEAKDLYEFDLNESGTPQTHAVVGELEGVLGGGGDDLSHVYLVSREACAPGAEAGKPNLYLREPGESCEAEDLTLIAELVEGDVGAVDPGASGLAYDVAEREARLRPVRISTDGSRLLFLSRARLTGYDNTDQVNGKADVEVFSYGADTDELDCISCNPSEARPVGRELRKPFWATAPAGHGVFAAAWIPVPEQQLRASNLISPDGNRVFFNSNDALLPRDTNSTMDVYQWEAAGTGSCTAADDNPSYFPQNGGCLDLISTGESPFESEFWDASESGDDVFFTTESSIVPPDMGLVDLYDARVGGGYTYPEATTECEGEACQSPPPPPEFPVPASGSYDGPENETPAADCTRPARRAAALLRKAKRASDTRKARKMESKAKALARKAKRCRRQSRRAGS